MENLWGYSYFPTEGCGFWWRDKYRARETNIGFKFFSKNDAVWLHSALTRTLSVLDPYPTRTRPVLDPYLEFFFLEKNGYAWVRMQRYPGSTRTSAVSGTGMAPILPYPCFIVCNPFTITHYVTVYKTIHMYYLK